MAGRIYHWKHGWIPLDHYAAAEKAHGRASVARLGRDQQIADIQKLLDNVRADPGSVDYDDPKLFSNMDEVDGVKFRTFKSADLDPGEGAAKPHTFTARQKQEIADHLNELYAKFPEAEPVVIVGTEDRDNDGVTEWSGDRISLSSMIFSHRDIADSRASFGAHGTVETNSTHTDTEFRRGVITHEFGHALEMQQGDDSRDAGGRIANERVMPQDVGVDLPGYDGPPAPRYKADDLSGRTSYGQGNEYEWFAEAFADGVLNGPQASESGKRVLALASNLYGPR